MSPAPRRIARALARAVAALSLALAARVVAALLRVVARTSRTIVLRPEHDLDRRGEACVVATLHQGLLVAMHHFRGRGAIVMASRSRDGDFVSALLRRLGFHVARGSDLRGGAAALDEMIAFVRSGRGSAALTCDGPRGPNGAVKPGVLVLARDTGRPLVPCALWASRRLELSNWDRTLVPLPFGRIALCFGAPIDVPAGARPSELRRLRTELERRMEALLAEAREAAEAGASDGGTG